MIAGGISFNLVRGGIPLMKIEVHKQRSSRRGIVRNIKRLVVFAWDVQDNILNTAIQNTTQVIDSLRGDIVSLFDSMQRVRRKMVFVCQRIPILSRFL